MNDDVFSLASILNFSDSWFEIWNGEDLGGRGTVAYSENSPA